MIFCISAFSMPGFCRWFCEVCEVCSRCSCRFFGIVWQLRENMRVDCLCATNVPACNRNRASYGLQGTMRWDSSHRWMVRASLDRIELSRSGR